jgi:hypothetical protein
MWIAFFEWVLDRELPTRASRLDLHRLASLIDTLPNLGLTRYLRLADNLVVPISYEQCSVLVGSLLNLSVRTRSYPTISSSHRQEHDYFFACGLASFLRARYKKFGARVPGVCNSAQCVKRRGFARKATLYRTGHRDLSGSASRASEQSPFAAFSVSHICSRAALHAGEGLFPSGLRFEEPLVGPHY